MKRNIRFFYSTLLIVVMLFAIEASGQPFDREISKVPLDSMLDRTEISLLTCQPHEEVYSLYGHTAIRVVNPSINMDVAINWGVFDSSQPNFVVHFVFGQTDYMMAAVPIDYFLREYNYYGSAVYQQRLNLTKEEKNAILLALEKNSLPENKVYRYNFFYDNCTTRARDVILSALNGKVEYIPTEKQNGKMSFRDLIHWKCNGYPWCAWGNDILLGVKADADTKQEERQFLPEVLKNDFDSAFVVRQSGEKIALVDSAFWLLLPKESMAKPMVGFPLSPMLCALIVLLAIVVLTLAEKFWWKKKVKFFDITLFNVFGIVGLVLLAMVFSEHPTVQLNLQILLFCPLWLILFSPFIKWKKGDWIALFMLFLFFVGNFFQCYAEGMNILALALLIRIINGISIK